MIKIIAFILIIFSSPLSFALNYQEYILLHNSNLCSNYFNYIEEKHNIPQHLLRSISVVETGRWHSKAKFYFPWPWAVNQAGKSYYFSNKKEAIAAVKKMLESGLTNIDIGCMQINLHHHPKAFLNLNEAFEPKENIEYAAVFLKNHYKKLNNWQSAIASYHSQTELGKKYSRKINKIWSDYASGKIPHNYCTSNTGELSSCNSADSNTNEKIKEKLSFSTRNDINDSKPTVKKQRKESKRLKSVMVPYSKNNEID